MPTWGHVPSTTCCEAPQFKSCERRGAVLQFSRRPAAREMGPPRYVYVTLPSMGAAGTLPAAELAALGIKRLPADLGQALEALRKNRGERGLQAKRLHFAGCAQNDRGALPCASVRLRYQPPWVKAAWLSGGYNPQAARLLLAYAGFRSALNATLGETLVRAFLAVRQAEWDAFGGKSLQDEAAALYMRY
jgi:hypothetical protein